MRVLVVVTGFVLVFLGLTGAQAQTTVAKTQSSSSFDRYEIRTGLLVHDPVSPESGSADLNLEVLAPRLPLDLSPAWSFLVPRPHLGGTLNMAGRTSHLYGGLSWGYDLTPKIFAEASWGGSLNNGETGPVIHSDRNAMGCHAGFRESATLGYRLTADLSVMLMIEHVSNGGLCNPNRGLTNAGLRFGASF